MTQNTPHQPLPVLPKDVEERFIEMFCFEDFEPMDGEMVRVHRLRTNIDQTQSIKQFIATELHSAQEQAVGERDNTGKSKTCSNGNKTKDSRFTT